MSTRTKAEGGPHTITGDVINPAQRGEVTGRREDEVDWLLPRKPVIHRRRPSPRMQGSLDPYDFEKMTISKHTKGILSPQEDNSTGIRKINSFIPSKDLLEPQREDVEMGRLIQAKKLMLLETLLNFEEKVRKKLQRVGTTVGEDGERKERSHVWPHTRMSEQRRTQPVAQREDRTEERGQEGANHLRRKQRQRDEDRMRKAHREEGGVWRVAGVRPEPRREVHGTSMENERIGKAFIMNSSENEQETAPLTPHEAARSLSTENHRAAEGKTFEGMSSLPPISNPAYSSRPQQDESGTDASFHLLPCRICNRKFMSSRLEKHALICKKVNQSRRRIFNSYNNRTKGSAIEAFWKTHGRSKTPELFEPNSKRKHLHQSRLPAAISEST